MQHPIRGILELQYYIRGILELQHLSRSENRVIQKCACHFSVWDWTFVFQFHFFSFVSLSCGFHFARRLFPRYYVFFLLKDCFLSIQVSEVLSVTRVFFIGTFCFTFNLKVRVIIPFILSQNISIF